MTKKLAKSLESKLDYQYSQAVERTIPPVIQACSGFVVSGQKKTGGQREREKREEKEEEKEDDGGSEKIKMERV